MPGVDAWMLVAVLLVGVAHLVAFIVAAIGAWKAYQEGRKSAEYAAQQLEFARDIRREESERHRIDTRNLDVSDMTPEMVELMLVLACTPMTFQHCTREIPEKPSRRIVVVAPYLAPIGVSSVDPEIGTFRDIYPSYLFFDALNRLELYGLVQVNGGDVYELTPVGRLMIGKLWYETPYKEEYEGLYNLIRGI